MIRRTALLLALALFAAPLYAGFHDVAAALEQQLGEPTWIPFFGLARSFIRVVHPDGVHDVQLAVFEGKGRLDGRVVEQLLASRIGPGFSPMVRTRSRAESVFIYARPAGNNVEMVILSSEHDDTVLIRVVADPEAISRIERDGHVHGVSFVADKD